MGDTKVIGFMNLLLKFSTFCGNIFSINTQCPYISLIWLTFFLCFDCFNETQAFSSSAGMFFFFFLSHHWKELHTGFHWLQTFVFPSINTSLYTLHTLLLPGANSMSLNVKTKYLNKKKLNKSYIKKHSEQPNLCVHYWVTFLMELMPLYVLANSLQGDWSE